MDKATTIDQIQMTAHYAREEGWEVDIDTRFPTIDISFEGETEWYFQEHEAQRLLDEVPEDVSAEDYLLWSSAGW